LKELEMTKRNYLHVSLYIFFAIFLAACAAGVAPVSSAYTNPAKTVEEHRRDTMDCSMRAQQMSHARMARGQSILDFRESDYFDECMRDKGYDPAN
jgi:PBP1b-binding outer membrane lipoprotein LpoB